MKKIRRPTHTDPVHLTTRELIAEHERVFGPLTPQAKQRLQRAADVANVARWEGMDGLAA